MEKQSKNKKQFRKVKINENEKNTWRKRNN